MHSCTHGCRHKSHELEHDSLTITCIKVKIPLKCIHVPTWTNTCETFRKKTITQWYPQKVTFVWNFLKARDILHEFGSSYLLYKGSIFCCFFCLLSFVGSLKRKNFGANSTSHFGSMAVTSLMYSLVVRTSSW